MIDMDSVKVSLAAATGVSVPVLDKLVGTAEPIARMLLLTGQIVVTIVTILYIWRKWRNIKRK